MTTPNETTVTSFIREFDQPAPDPETIGAYFTDDAVYHNIMMKPIVGKAAIAATVGGWKAMMLCAGWELKNQLASGDIVINERVDRFTAGGKPVELPVVGVFELRDGKIAGWRDYFDMAQFRSQMG